jgi:hypothetical protein
MASTYTDSLKLELMATGANANTWGNNTNTNLQTIDAFGAGYLAKSVAGSSNVTLTSNNADPTAEASKKVIEFTGTLTGNIYVFIPAVENNYIFFNNTSGAFTLTVAPTGHAANGVAIVQGSHTIQYCTGNKVIDLFANSLGNVSAKGVTSVNGSTQVQANGQIVATSFTGNGSGLDGVTTLDPGTQMVFLQSSAPTGWTQNTASTLANATLRVITSGSAGTGGADAFATTFSGSKSTSGSGTADVSPLGVSAAPAGATTISTPQLPSHTHTYVDGDPRGYRLYTGDSDPVERVKNVKVSNGPAGGSGSHSHSLSGSLSLSGTISAPSISLSVPGMDLKHANVIVCSKDA